MLTMALRGFAALRVSCNTVVARRGDERAPSPSQVFEVIASVQYWRARHAEVETFAQFLEEALEADDLVGARALVLSACMCAFNAQ
jgi:hypothetical protein